jgi:hypothetical protein
MVEVYDEEDGRKNVKIMVPPDTKTGAIGTSVKYIE